MQIAYLAAISYLHVDKLEVFSEDTLCAALWKVALRCKWYHVWFHAHILLSALFAWCLVFCFRDGTLAHWVTHSLGVTQDSRVARYLKRILWSTPLILICVCVMWTHVVCIHKAPFPFSLRSVVSLARLSHVASETTHSAQLSLYSCVVVLS